MVWLEIKESVVLFDDDRSKQLTLCRASSQFECYNEELIFFSVPYIPVYMGIYYLRACDKF